jgi:hypothetical protein
MIPRKHECGSSDVELESRDLDERERKVLGALMSAIATEA